MNITEFYAFLERLAPRSLSAPWDNDGIMCNALACDEVKKVLVALDASSGAIRKASDEGYDVLLTHHPMIFKGLKSITGEDTVSSRAILALSGGVSVISLHTRLDAADGGVNDALARAVGLDVSGKFGDSETPELGRLCEIPETDADELALRVKNALGCSAVRVTGSGKISRVAVVGGEGKDFIIPAMNAGADVLITGDAGYNACEAAAERGFCIIEAGHYHTEFPVCAILAKYINALGITADVYAECPNRFIL